MYRNNLQNTIHMDIKIILSEVSDPRRSHLQVHTLECIFGITIAAVMGGADSWYEVEDFGYSHEAFFRRHIKTYNGIPSHDTFNRVFSLISPDELERGFRKWVNSIWGKPLGTVAIDGKEICGAREELRNGCRRMLRMVSAWSCEGHVSLGQVKVSDKSNEITAIPKLLRALDMTGNVVTIDSIGCQRKIVSKIDTRKTDFVIQVKENQKGLLNSIKTMFDWLDSDTGCPFPGWLSEHVSEEKGHGRIEKRHCMVLTNRVIERIIKWEKVKSIVCIVNFRKDLKTLERSEERHYYITSIKDDAGRVAKAVREHWQVENNLHWQLDVSFDEDDTRKKGNAARNFSLITKIVLAEIKKSTRKGSIKGRRKAAGWNEEYLLELLSDL